MGGQRSLVGWLEEIEWMELRCRIGDGGEQSIGKKLGENSIIDEVLERVGSLSNTRHNPVLKSLDIEDVQLN